MKNKTNIILPLIIILLIVLTAPLWAAPGDRNRDMCNSNAPTDPDPCEAHKISHYLITAPGLSGLGGVSTSPGGELSVDHTLLTPGMLARRDYQQVYDQAQALLTVGVDFRHHTLTLAPTASTLEEALKNYADFIHANDTFYKFCADYNQINEQGYCPGTDRSQWPTTQQDIRSQLIRARELYAFLSLAEPFETTIQQGEVRQLGRTGVLSSTREIANIHLIFGNEFLVDALDYRFSAGSSPSADQIIQTEIAQLALALQQFTMAVDVLAHAFNADFGGPHGVYIGDYFTAQEFELFGLASERMILSMEEIANRHRQLGQNEQALAIYTQGAAAQYMQALALAHKAAEQDVDFLNNGGFQIIANLNRLRAMAQTVHDGINPFGFMDEYVPLQGYGYLLTLTQDQFYRDAIEDENAAREAQRTFDYNATALNQELQNLRLTYNNQLLELCGNDFELCDGGLMLQNYIAMQTAYKRIQLAKQRLDHIPEKIQIEDNRSTEVIRIQLEGGEELAALAYTIGVRNSYRETKSVVESETNEWRSSINIQATSSLNPLTFFGLLDTKVSASTGYNHSRSKTTSTSKVWDPAQKEIGRLNGLRDVQQAATQSQITGANSEATIRTLLLQQADLMIELDITIDELNRLSAEHNHLVEKYHNLLNLRVQAQDNVIDSYLNNPAYRILRDNLTIEGSRSHDLAAQFAYLTAKSLEYEFLSPVPFMNDIFKARTADDVDNFLIQLEQRRVALGNPGYLNRYPYVISIAQDLQGLSDQNLSPAENRYHLFQDFLQQHTTADTLEFQFTTSLLDNNIFSPSIWNNRIAGVGLPTGVPGTEGIALNIITRQFGDVGTPEVKLIHSGQASYRTATNHIIEYTPGRTMLVGYPLPEGFQTKDTAATILSSVNGNEQGTANSALFNLSVAASSWTLKIDLSSPFNKNLDLSKIEDIEILMDTTAISLAGKSDLAAAESRSLITAFAQAKRHNLEAASDSGQ